MKTNITISGTLLTITGKTFNADDYAAQAEGTEVIIVHKVNSRERLFQAAVGTLKFNGATYATAPLYCKAFNTLAAAAMKRNTDYPDSIISAVLTPNDAGKITNYAKSGSVILYAPDANTGVIYVGGSGVDNTCAAIEAGNMLPIEHSDLSKWYVKNSVEGETVHVIGSYKS